MSSHDFIAVGRSLTTDFSMHLKVRDRWMSKVPPKWGSKISKSMIFTFRAIKSWPKGVRKCSWVFWKGLRLFSPKILTKKIPDIFTHFEDEFAQGGQNLVFLTDFNVLFSGDSRKPCSGLVRNFADTFRCVFWAFQKIRGYPCIITPFPEDQGISVYYHHFGPSGPDSVSPPCEGPSR